MLIQCRYKAGPASQTLVERCIGLHDGHIVDGRSLAILHDQTIELFINMIFCAGTRSM